MANEKVNKVVLGNEVLIDITDSTVTANNMLLGTKAYGADGKPITGVLEVGSTIIVTTPETTLFGEDVTLTDGVTTLTETFSNQGVATFDSVIMTGNLTVSATDGVSSGSVTFPVTTFKTYNISLVLIPDGKTITPTDDVATWLKCAQIDNRNYTTLSQVLNDPYTLEKLLSNSNACDYMARSTGFASGLIPKMTSNTTPSGEASASSIWSSGFEAYRAFDGDDSTKWSGATSTNESLTYAFPNEVKVRKVFIKADVYSGNIRVKNFELRSSNDSSFATYNTEYQGAIPSDTNGELTFYINSSHSARYWMTYCADTHSTGSTISIDTLQFYAQDASIVDDADTMAMIGKYDYCCEALLGNATWADAIAHSDYADIILDTSVPYMTSETTPSGQIIASSSVSAYLKYNICSFYSTGSNNNNAWASKQVVWLGYKFPQKVLVTRITGNFYVGTGSPSATVKFQGSNDNNTWDDLATWSSWYPSFGTLSGSDFVFDNIIENDEYYQYYRLWADDYPENYSPYGRAWRNGKWNMYGHAEHSVQVDIIHSAPNDGLYYLDDEGTEVPLTTTDPNGIGIVDFSDLPEGDLTIYSSVAKDPDNLSNDYGRTFKITRNTVELWLMPVEGVLYWYGYLASDVTVASAGVTDVTASGYTHQSPTFNAYYVTMNASGGSDDCYMFKKDIGDATSVNVIASGSGYAFIKAMNILPYDFATTVGHVIDTTLGSTKQKYSLTITSEYNKATAVRANAGGQITMDAWWTE